MEGKQKLKDEKQSKQRRAYSLQYNFKYVTEYDSLLKNTPQSDLGLLQSNAGHNTLLIIENLG